VKPFSSSGRVAHTSTLSNGGGKSTPSAPTTVYGAPFSVSVEPTARSSPLNCRSQNRRPMTTVALPGRSSSGRNVRPAIASTTPSATATMAASANPLDFDSDRIA
jgi:hypothetical protein